MSNPLGITLHPEKLQSVGFEFDTNADGSIMDSIGHGGYGAVYRGICLPEAINWYKTGEDGSPIKLYGKVCAIKCIYISPTNATDVYKEAQEMSELKHENIVDIYAVIRVANLTCYIVMEFLFGGTFKNFLEQRLEKMRKLSKDETIDLFMQLLNGLEYLHTKGKAHGDLTRENVMCDMSANDKYVWKYVDFGLTTTSAEKLQKDLYDLGLLFQKIVQNSELIDNELVNIVNRMALKEYHSIVNVCEDIRNRLDQYL